MNVSDHQKNLQAIKTKEAASAAAANFRATRRQRSLLTREASNLSNNASIEAAEYHAQEPAAVPFIWESSPGTPKRHVIKKKSPNCHEIDHDLMLPPLTPPPSYMYRNKSSTTRVSKKKSPNDANNNNVNNLIQAIFPKLSIKRDNPPTLSSSSSTKSSSSSSSSSLSSSHSRFVESSPSPIHNRQKRLSFEYTSSPQIGEEEIHDEVGSPVSPLCFRRLSCCNRMFRGL